MAFNFPDSPAEGQVFSPSAGVSFVSRSGIWRKAPTSKALPKNYVLNSPMLVSQQNGDAASPAAAGGNWWTADQWQMRWSFSGGSAVAARWGGAVPLAGNATSYITVQTPKPTLAATDYMLLTHAIEGWRVADLLWGTAAAKSVVLQFTMLSSVVAGTYSVRIANNLYNRSYVASFSLPIANAWYPISLSIPGDTMGTWERDTDAGMRIEWCMGIGTTYQGVLGWQDGDKYAPAGITNGMGAAGTFHLMRPALYVDPFNTQAAPSQILPTMEHHDRIRARRYYYRQQISKGVVPVNTLNEADMEHPAPMRVIPSLGLVGTPRAFDGPTIANITGITTNSSNSFAFGINSSVSAALVAGRGAVQLWDSDTTGIDCNARM